MFLITQVLCLRQSCLYGMGTGYGVLTHLSEDHSHLIQKICFQHLVIELFTFTASLTDTDEDRVGFHSLVDIVDQLFDQYSLTYSGTTEKAHLETFLHRCEEVQHLNTSPEDIAVDIDL